MLKYRVLVPLLVISLVVVGCAKPTKQQILDDSRGVRTEGELKQAIGKPDDVEALAMFEQWTYECSDGHVIFHLAGGKVIFRDTLRRK